MRSPTFFLTLAAASRSCVPKSTSCPAGYARPHGLLLRARQPLLSETPSLEVDVDGLRKEAQRVLYRTQKKLSKAEERVRACEAKEAELLSRDDATLEELEALPNCEELRDAATSEEERLGHLQKLVDGLRATTSVCGDKPTVAGLLEQAAALGVNDHPPKRPPPKPKKIKGPRASSAPRLPYRIFRSESGAEIRVGRAAKDNDALSIDAEHRDPDDWWLHASGCPGSHVVIRACTLPGDLLPREVELDAAVLAANYSKAALTGNVAVNLCRARQVSKPFGAKPGLVQLSGEVKTIKLNWQKERVRLERLADAL